MITQKFLLDLSFWENDLDISRLDLDNAFGFKYLINPICWMIVPFDASYGYILYCDDWTASYSSREEFTNKGVRKDSVSAAPVNNYLSFSVLEKHKYYTGPGSFSSLQTFAITAKKDFLLSRYATSITTASYPFIIFSESSDKTSFFRIGDYVCFKKNQKIILSNLYYNDTNTHSLNLIIPFK